MFIHVTSKGDDPGTEKRYEFNVRGAILVFERFWTFAKEGPVIAFWEGTSDRFNTISEPPLPEDIRRLAVAEFSNQIQAKTFKEWKENR